MMIGFSTLLTTVVGTLIGAIKDMWMMGQKAKNDERQAILRQAGLVMDDRQRATRMFSKGVQFTRRIIVVSFMAILLTPIYLLIGDPNVVFNIPVHVMKEGWGILFGLISSGGVEKITYIQVTGFTYLVAILDLLGFIVGYYFGSGGTNTRY
jgi:hypothetical protein